MGIITGALEDHVCHERGLLSSFDLDLLNQLLGTKVYVQPMSIKIGGYEFLGFNVKEVVQQMTKTSLLFNTVTIAFCKDHGISLENLEGLVPLTTGTKKVHKNYLTSQVFEKMVKNDQWIEYVKHTAEKDQSITDDERNYLLNY